MSDEEARLCRDIVAAAPDAIVFADRDGLIRLWNAGAETIFGWTGDEAVGKTLDLIIPERLRKRHWDGYRTVMATGSTRYGRELLSVPALRKDGSRISIEFSIALLRDDRGEPVGPAAIIRDVSERWNEQKKLEQRLASLEPPSRKP